MHDQWPPRGSPGWQQHSPPVHGPTYGSDPLWMLLGRLDERSLQTKKWQEETTRWQERTERRLCEGDKRFTALETHKDEMPGWEIALKRPLPILIGVLVLAITGKLEVAVRLVEALGMIAAAAN